MPNNLYMILHHCVVVLCYVMLALVTDEIEYVCWMVCLQLDSIRM